MNARRASSRLLKRIFSFFGEGGEAMGAGREEVAGEGFFFL